MYDYRVYAHVSLEGEVFYVGICRTKWRPGEKQRRNSIWKRKVNKIKEYNIVIVAENMCRESALSLESLLMFDFDPVANICKDGDWGTFEFRMLSKEDQEKWKKRSSETMSRTWREKGQELKEKMKKARIAAWQNPELRDKYLRERADRKKPVLCLNNCVIYESYQAAAKKLGISVNSVQKALSSGRAVCEYYFERLEGF